MAFVLPTFNITVNIWRGTTLTSSPPDLTPTANLCLGKRAGADLNTQFYSGTAIGPMWLLLPKLTDIRDAAAASGADTVEAPAGSGKFYTVQWVDDIGQSFPNEHRFAVLLKLLPWSTPFGGGTPPPAPPPPPQFFTQFGTSSGAATVSSISAIINTPAPGHVAAALHWINNVNPGQINGLALVPGNIAQYVHAGVTVNVGAMTFRVPAGSTLLTMTMVGGGNALMSMVGNVVLGQGLGATITVHGAGVGPPTMTPPASGFGLPFSADVGFVAAVNHPSPVGVNSPYSTPLIVPFGNVLGGANYDLWMTVLGSPPSTPPVWTFTPAGWSQWAAANVELVSAG